MLARRRQMTTTVKYVMITLDLSVLNILLALEAVADPPYRLDETWLVRVVGKLLAEVPDVNVDGSGVPYILVAPDFLHQAFARKDYPRVRGEDVEQVELFRGQLDFAQALYLHLSTARVQGDTSAGDYRLLFLEGSLRPPQHRLDARHQFPRAERLCQVVVGAQLQAHDLIPVSYTHLRAHETRHDLVCRLLLEKKKNKKK